jgi:hypothetical protein
MLEGIHGLGGPLDPPLVEQSSVKIFIVSGIIRLCDVCCAENRECSRCPRACGIGCQPIVDNRGCYSCHCNPNDGATCAVGFSSLNNPHSFLSCLTESCLPLKFL